LSDGPDNFKLNGKKSLKTRLHSAKTPLICLLLAVGIFSLGVEVGKGNIRLVSNSSASINKSLPTKLDYSAVDQVYNLLKKDYDGQLSTDKLMDGLKAGLVEASGDPYTEYFSAKDAKSFNEALSGSFTGIGAELGTDSDSRILIVSPLSGYPAQKAGLQTKDIITAVNGETTTGLSVDKAVQKIRGEAGTKVTLSISRGGGKPFDVVITRAKIDVPSVDYKVDGNLGYMKINQFSQDTPALARKAAQAFKDQNVKAVVLDLRGNPGGYLSGAVDVSSLWLGEGATVVQEKRGNQVISTEYAHGDSPLKGLPTVVLINGGSASASEITAGALKDNGAATLVGTKSFGKGSVQQVEDLPGGAELKITIARWYTPKGANIDKQGIKPDTEAADPTDEQYNAGQDPQKDKAYQIVQGKISH
jgi:carboxyl-terminal processing protease